ncbi:MAG: glycosyltransferase family 4 protein [Luminiphilus sp.]|nr:glycosyltransferase family 4 protein [Luminiphilus sp.]MDG2494578.1 glycosyltransferase family 4 protein [Luminiphilus sp.]
MASSPTLKLLYISAVQSRSGEGILSLQSRINIGVLSRDFEISLAVVGPVTAEGLHRLRVDLGPLRVTGGFEASSADTDCEKGLKRLMKERFGTTKLCARLQTTIQRNVEAFDAVVIDGLLSWPYRPIGTDVPIAFIPYGQGVMDSEENTTGIGSDLREPYLVEVCREVEMVFIRPSLAARLSERGVSMRQLQYSFSHPTGAKPTLAEVDFNRTEPRIGFNGYLGDAGNVASVNWFLKEIWPVAQRVIPGVEFHIVGSAPSREFIEQVSAMSRVVLHWSTDDHQLLDQRCRVVIEPLLFEDHVDAKLVNAMARGIPTVTTRHAMRRSHFRMRSGVVVADSREEMVVAINRMMSDSVFWKRAAREGMAAAREQLPRFELAHCIRRELNRYHRHSLSG